MEATILLVTQQQRQALAQRVRSEMERQSLDNVRLARSANVSEKTISRIINARLSPRYSTIERLSVGLGLKPDELWRVVGAASPRQQTKSNVTPDPFSSDDQLARIEDKLDMIVNVLGTLAGADALAAAREDIRKRRQAGS